MSLIVEDGTIVANADSYTDLATIRAYATKRGYTSVTAVDADLEVIVIKAMDWLEAKLRSNGKGYIVSDSQALQYPRTDVYINRGLTLIASDSIPQLLIDALCQIVVEISEGLTDLSPTLTDSRVKIKEKLDVLEVEYAHGTSSGQANNPIMRKVDDLLADLLRGGSFSVGRA